MPGVFASGAVAALTFYALRRVRSPAVEWGWLVFAACLFTAAMIAWLLARRGFFSREDARVFLEYQLRLDSRLSAAESGIAHWPAQKHARVLAWKKTNAAGWLAGALAMIAAGLWLPVPAPAALRVAPIEKPPALAQTEEWLKELEQANIVDEQSLENLKEQARELASKPTENQYTHSALEAADTLRQQTAQAMQNLSDNFQMAADTLSTINQSGMEGADAAQEGMSEEQLRRASEQLGKALQGLRDGTLTPGKELADALNQVDLSNLRELSPEEAARLAQRLRDAGREIGGICEGVLLDEEGDEAGRLAMLAAGPDGKPSQRAPGSGGVDRGRGDAPLSFDNHASDAGAGNMQTVQNSDFSRAALGDKIGTQIGEHTVDQNTAAAPMSAGGMSGSARGGDAVWVNKLTPAEREALKEFYK